MVVIESAVMIMIGRRSHGLIVHVMRGSQTRSTQLRGYLINPAFGDKSFSTYTTGALIKNCNCILGDQVHVSLFCIMHIKNDAETTAAQLETNILFY